MREYLRQIRVVARKDLAVELRARERIIAMAAFAVLVAILFNFAVDRTAVRMQEIAAGLIWMTIVFTGLVGLGRSFHAEEEDQALLGVLLSPAERGAIYLGKVVANFVVLSVVEALIFGTFALFFNLSYGDHAGALVVVVALATVGFTALGILFGAIATNTRMGDTVLPILIVPLLVPVLVYGVSATGRLFAGRPVSEVAGSVRMLAAFALVFTAAGTVLFRYVVEE